MKPFRETGISQPEFCHRQAGELARVLLAGTCQSGTMPRIRILCISDGVTEIQSVVSCSCNSRPQDFEMDERAQAMQLRCISPQRIALKKFRNRKKHSASYFARHRIFITFILAFLLLPASADSDPKRKTTDRHSLSSANARDLNPENRREHSKELSVYSYYKKCKDNASYISPQGLSCPSHSSWHCEKFGLIGFTQREVEELLTNCPQSCNIPCSTERDTPNIFIDFNTKGVDVDLSGMVAIEAEERGLRVSIVSGIPDCLDDPKYKSPQNLPCGAYVKWDCTMFTLIGFSKYDVYDLISACPESCNYPCGSFTLTPSLSPSLFPTASPKPSSKPSIAPTLLPSVFPTVVPSSYPSKAPSEDPTFLPSVSPSAAPTPFSKTSVTETALRLDSVKSKMRPEQAAIFEIITKQYLSKSLILSPSKVNVEIISVSVTSQIPSSYVDGEPDSYLIVGLSIVGLVTPFKHPKSFSFHSLITSVLASDSNSFEQMLYNFDLLPSKGPSIQPSRKPSTSPSQRPTFLPSVSPTGVPSVLTSSGPSTTPSNEPSATPSLHPSEKASQSPSKSPSVLPSSSPSAHPTFVPSAHPSSLPSASPSLAPTIEPSFVEGRFMSANVALKMVPVPSEEMSKSSMTTLQTVVQLFLGTKFVEFDPPIRNVKVQALVQVIESLHKKQKVLPVYAFKNTVTMNVNGAYYRPAENEPNFSDLVENTINERSDSLIKSLKLTGDDYFQSVVSVNAASTTAPNEIVDEESGSPDNDGDKGGNDGVAEGSSSTGAVVGIVFSVLLISGAAVGCMYIQWRKRHGSPNSFCGAKLSSLLGGKVQGEDGQNSQEPGSEGDKSESVEGTEEFYEGEDVIDSGIDDDLDDLDNVDEDESTDGVDTEGIEPDLTEGIRISTIDTGENEGNVELSPRNECVAIQKWTDTIFILNTAEQQKRRVITTLKKDANNKFKTAKYQEACDLYTTALSVLSNKTGMANSMDETLEEEDRQLLVALLANRAAAHLQLSNYRSCIDDCTKAVGLENGCVKAYIRGTKSMVELGLFDEAFDFISTGHKHNSNSALLVSELKKTKYLRNNMNLGVRQLEEHDFASAQVTFAKLLQGWGSGNATIRRGYEKANFEVRKRLRPDYYEILGVSSVASASEIKKQYKKRVLKSHPDRFLGSEFTDEQRKEAEDMFKLLGEAFEVLGDDFTRQLYNQGYDQDAIEEKVAANEQAEIRNDAIRRNALLKNGEGSIT